MVTLPFTCSYLLMLIILSRPDRCDGTYDANCDSSRAYSNITAICFRCLRASLSHTPSLALTAPYYAIIIVHSLLH